MSGQYLLFAGDHYCPGGGIHDFVGRGTLDECLSMVRLHHEWWHIVDIETMRIVEHQERP